MPKVSIIVPVYGVEPYIRECLDSLIGQTFQDIEIIVVDDGSPDGCPAIIDEYAQADKRITAIHKDNGGVSAARNDGLAKASGDYVFFCDSDDWLPLDAIEAFVESAETFDSDVVIGDCVERNGEASREIEMFSNEFQTTNPETIAVIQKAIFNKGHANYSSSDFTRTHGLGAPWHHLIRRSLIEDNGIRFDLSVRGLFDDGIFMLEVFEHAKRVSYINKSTYFYRIVAGSMTHGYKADILDRYQMVYSRIEDFMSRYCKGDDFRKAYYVRVYAYLNKAMDVYFHNPSNDKPENVRYAEYKRTLKAEPYKSAISGLDVSKLWFKRSRILASMLKSHAYKMYWKAKKTSAKAKDA